MAVLNEQLKDKQGNNVNPITIAENVKGLSAVATSNNYNDLDNKPTIPANTVQYTAQTLSDAQKRQARSNINAGTSNFTGNYDDLVGKPGVIQYSAPQALNNLEQQQARENMGVPRDGLIIGSSLDTPEDIGPRDPDRKPLVIEQTEQGINVNPTVYASDVFNDKGAGFDHISGYDANHTCYHLRVVNAPSISSPSGTPVSIEAVIRCKKLTKQLGTAEAVDELIEWLKNSLECSAPNYFFGIGGHMVDDGEASHVFAIAYDEVGGPGISILSSSDVYGSFLRGFIAKGYITIDNDIS